MYCCPTLFATEKYKYNLKTNNFERVYQSELTKKNYEKINKNYPIYSFIFMYNRYAITCFL